MLKNTSISEDVTADDTAMAEAFAKVGVARDETPQKAAERIWKKETKCDPVKTMVQFKEWALAQPCPCCGTAVKPTRLLGIFGKYVDRILRSFLEKNQVAKEAWKYSDVFRKAMRRQE